MSPDQDIPDASDTGVKIVEHDTGVSGKLTDGSGIGTFTAPKIVKDLILDFLLTAPAALIGINVMNLDAAIIAPGVVAIALLDAGIRVVYRGLLKWAQS